MGAGNTNYFTSIGESVFMTPTNYYAPAMGFRTGPTPYVFTELQLPLRKLSGADNLTISLRADAGAGPAAVIETLSVNSSVFPVYPQPMIVTSLFSTAFPTLAPNSVYWITLEPTDNRSVRYTWGLLNSITEPQISGNSYNFSGTTRMPWHYNYADPYDGDGLAIYGNAVPEPSMISLVASGVLFLVCRIGLRTSKHERTKATA
jgi:hypothetical protein